MASSVPQYTALATEVRDGVYILCLNRPARKNAFNREMYEECVLALQSATSDDRVRTLFLTGSGDYFSSGNDLTNFLKADPSKLEEQLKESQDLLLRFVHAFCVFPKPIIAAVNGPAIGIACTILGHADLVYGSKSCTFNTPFMQLAQSPEGCSSLLFPESMGRLKANELLLLGKTFSATEALQATLLNAVFEETGQQFTDKVFAIAKKMASYPVQAMQLSKKLIKNERRMAELEESNRAEVELLGERWASAECMEAVMNFMSRPRENKAKL